MKRAELGTTGRIRVLALLLALVPEVALAQASTSVLTGNVVDTSTKQPVADVVVTATSPTLQGEQVVVTDSTGLYRVPQLPPGTYTTMFFLRGPYNPNDTNRSSNQTAQFCRQCHGDKSNEMYGGTARTVF